MGASPAHTRIDFGTKPPTIDRIANPDRQGTATTRTYFGDIAIKARQEPGVASIVGPRTYDRRKFGDQRGRIFLRLQGRFGDHFSNRASFAIVRQDGKADHLRFDRPAFLNCLLRAVSFELNYPLTF